MHPSDLKDNVLGFRVLKTVELTDIHSHFYELIHTDTGARYIHIANNDTENTFAVAFKTVPTDSTGVAHILEHTVLCGSKKFPVRDPFFSMLKRGLSTFMNAFTASDWTMYPFSTQNRKDFYNLMDVYLDAAFFPIIDELSFKQEGHRLEIEDNGNDPASVKLNYKGVVYNEMKGAMSSPDQIFARSLLETLYPDTTYRFNSGGNPEVIPRLTYEQLKAFHARHYHPSNAFFYTYGNLPLKDHLAFIESKILNHFKRIDPQTDVPSQPKWLESRKAVYPYPLDKNEDPAKKCQVCVAWITADIKDTFEVLVLALLEQILIGNPASPLRKALIDSELGTALCDSVGFDADNRDTLFVVGLKEVKENDAETIERIIFDVIRSLCEEGIDKELIETAIHQIEFHHREITNTPYPFGLKLLMRITGTWFHGGSPEKILQFDESFNRIRQELAAGAFFENRLKTYFLDNPHRVRFTLIPDHSLSEKETRQVRLELEERAKMMNRTELEKIQKDTAALAQQQQHQEDLSVLPTLALEDIPPSVHCVSPSNKFPTIPAACYRQPTSGIFYFSAAAGTAVLPDKLVPLVPFFCYAFPKAGTARYDYAEITRRIAASTGGIVLESRSRTRFDEQGTCVPFVSFSGKCLNRNQEKMFEIIEELKNEFAFTDLTRIKNLLMEYKAALEASVVHNGHRLAISLASRKFSAARGLSESWHGIHQLQFIKNINLDANDGTLEALVDDLVSIGKTIFVKDNFRVALVGEGPQLEASSHFTRRLHDHLGPASADGFTYASPEVDQPKLPEGWYTSSAVSFVAGVFKTVRLEHKDAPALAVISKMLRSLYLHREIREKGGAYGGFAIYNPEDGLFTFASYRDPHIISTLNTYREAAGFIKSAPYNNEDIKEAVLQICSEFDKPDPPGPAAKKAFYRDLLSMSDEKRKKFKQNLLKLSRDQVVAAAETYFKDDYGDYGVAVISNEEKLNAANENLGDQAFTLFRI
jgi:Zn-dependent M16 (insulinase) family peptidase